MTDQPRTLLQIAGASPAPANPARAALVLMDAQREYTDGALRLDGIDAAVAEAKRLLDLARREGMPVIHIHHHGRAGGPAFAADGPFVAPIAGLEPEAGETVVTKSLPNAFAGTELDRILRDTGRSDIILAGFATHMCVSATARAALDLGHRCTVVAGATATRALPDALGGGAVPAAAVQQAALAAIADRFATVIPDAAALAPTPA